MGIIVFILKQLDTARMTSVSFNKHGQWRLTQQQLILLYQSSDAHEASVQWYIELSDGLFLKMKLKNAYVQLLLLFIVGKVKDVQNAFLGLSWTDNWSQQKVSEDVSSSDNLIKSTA